MAGAISQPRRGRPCQNVCMDKGLTLPEVMLTLVILALLTSFAMPRFDVLLAESRSASIVSQLVARIENARKSALVRGETLTLCPGRESCAGRDDWISGALLFSDHDADGRMDTGEPLLRRFSALGSSGQVRWRSFGNRPWIQFLPNGSTPSQSGRLTYCPQSGDPRIARELILNAAGRIRHAKDSDGDGIRESSDGTPLTCA